MTTTVQPVSWTEGMVVVEFTLLDVFRSAQFMLMLSHFVLAVVAAWVVVRTAVEKRIRLMSVGVGLFLASGCVSHAQGVFLPYNRIPPTEIIWMALVRGVISLAVTGYILWFTTPSILAVHSAEEYQSLIAARDKSLLEADAAKVELANKLRSIEELYKILINRNENLKRETALMRTQLQDFSDFVSAIRDRKEQLQHTEELERRIKSLKDKLHDIRGV